MPVDFENSSAMTASNSASGEASVSSGNQPPPPLPPPPTAAAAAAAAAKKKRSLPGMPDPDAEVMALSPKTLLATNRFICEVCKKGFQRDQNLQLHRRGHNLPWKLRQRSAGKEVRKKVYVCPETSCVHHDPSRALGDLTGIKKHFCRKHGEKKWKCERCSKKYAVQSDWKAHLKTCGTKEYRCDCGTLFSRRDSFITHRAFCDALAEETAKVQTIVQSPPLLEDDLPAERQEPESASTGMLQYLPPPPFAVDNNNGTCTSSGGGNNNTTSIFASLFVSSSSTSAHAPTTDTGFSDLPSSVNHRPVPTALHLSPFIAPTPQLSATALLQKAAQMGAAATSSSFLRGLGLAATSSSPPTHQRSWEPEAVAPVGMGLGIPDLFGPKRATLDLLGLGMGSGSAGGGLSAFMTSIGSRLDIGPGPSSGP